MKPTTIATKSAAANKASAAKAKKTKDKPVAKDMAAAAPVKSAAERMRDNPELRVILASLDDMKAEDSVTIDLSDKASIGETMVVTTGRSTVHVASIADRVVKDLKAHGYGGPRVEGLRQGDWVLIDTGSVIVHVFRPEVRAFYNIEKMWSA